MIKFKSKKSRKHLENRILPEHIGVIMDGNGRWAQKRGLPRNAGHKTGVANFKVIAKYANKIGIKYMTAYAFSTENWKRPQEEVDALMNLFEKYLKDTIRDFNEDNIRVRFIGDTSVLTPKIQELIEETKSICATKTGMVLNIAINYGGRDELVMAIKKIANDIKTGTLENQDITKKEISKRLYTADQPDVDLVIRTSGEYRISNFLLWQAAYAEYYITDIFWPDFKENDLEDAIDEFCLRNRRFGGI